MLNIIVDNRESRSEVYRALQNYPNVDVTIRELSCGDYVPHPDMAIERKAANDFVLSIMDGRLFAQVLRLKDEFKQVVFLIEGNPYKVRSLIKPESIRGALSYLIAIEGVSVMMVDSASESTHLIVTLARHMTEGLGYVPPLRADKPKTTHDLSRYLVEGCPGIGPAAAAALLKHFGSALRVFNASVPELCQVPGIGKKTAERMRAALENTL